MSKKAAYMPISFTPLDSGASSISQVTPHFLWHKFQSLTPSGEIVREEWLFFMSSFFYIISYADQGKGIQTPRSDFGKNFDKIGEAADSVVNNIINETIK